MTTPTVAERVAAGAAYLDQRWPGWWQRIDLDRLDLAASCNCILGQIHGDYFQYVTGSRRELQAQRLGFNACCPGPKGKEYAALTAAWRDLITARRTPADAGRISVAATVILIALACIIALAATGNWGQ